MMKKFTTCDESNTFWLEGTISYCIHILYHILPAKKVAWIWQWKQQHFLLISPTSVTLPWYIYGYLWKQTNPHKKTSEKTTKKPHQPNPNSHQRKQQNQPNKTDQTYLHSYYEIVELLSDSCLKKKKKSLCWSLYMAVSQAYLAANVHTLIIHMALRCK